MRPVPIPRERVPEGWPTRVPEGWPTRVIAGPDGDLTGEIRPVEAMIGETRLGPAIFVRLALDPGEIEQLAAGAPIWLITHADHLHVFGLEVGEL